MPTGELEGVLHLPQTSAVGACVVLHGFGGHPDQPHIVTTCATLADSGINIELISTSEIKISVVIALDKADEAARVAHKAFDLDQA